MILPLRTGALIGCQRQRLHVIFLAATAAKLARRHSLKPLTTQPHLSEFLDQKWPSWFLGDRHPKVPQDPRMRTALSRPPFTGLPCERYRTISRSRDIETPCICQTKVSLVTPLVGQNPLKPCATVIRSGSTPTAWRVAAECQPGFCSGGRSM
jgi:hypothetical protein